MARQIIVQILGDATKFNQATSQATGAAGKFGNVLQGIGQGIGISAFGGIAGAASMAASKIVDFTTDSIAAASDLREAMALTDQVFEDSAGKVEDWGSTAAESMGSSKAEAVNMAAIFGTQFKKIGMSLDDTADKSIELSELAGDLGSAFNTSSDEAATALRSGLLGESEPLRRFGVTLSETTVKAYLLAHGMKPVNGEFTEGQKVMARYNLIMEQTADSQGMFGRDSESLADTQKALTAEMTNLQAEIGTALLPIMVDLAKFVKDDVIPAVRDLGETLRDHKEIIDILGTAFDFLAGGPLNAAKKQVENYQKAEADATEETYGLTDATKDMAREHQFAGDAAGDLTRDLNAVGGAAGTTASKIRSLDDALNGLFDSIEGSYDLEQLRLQLNANVQELNIVNGRIRVLQGMKYRTPEQEKELADLLYQQSTLNEEIERGRAEIAFTNGASLSEILAEYKRLNRDGIGPTTAAARALYSILDRSQSAAERTRQAVYRTGTAYQARASGGPASGLTWVGEMGPELVNLPAGSYVHSNAESMSMPSGRGASPITIVVQGSVYGDMDQFADRLALRLRLAGA